PPHELSARHTAPRCLLLQLSHRNLHVSSGQLSAQFKFETASLAPQLAPKRQLSGRGDLVSRQSLADTHWRYSYGGRRCAFPPYPAQIEPESDYKRRPLCVPLIVVLSISRV